MIRGSRTFLFLGSLLSIGFASVVDAVAPADASTLAAAATDAFPLDQVRRVLQDHRRELQNGDGAAGLVCSLINNLLEDSIGDLVNCECQASSITCTYRDSICTDDLIGGSLIIRNNTCGKPQIALDLLDGANVRVCVLDMTHASLPDNQDFCLTLSLELGFVNPSCTATLGTDDCECTICRPLEDNEFGLAIQCPNVEARTECQSIPNYADIFENRDGEGFRGFLPNWQGFCSQLQEATGDLVECDCSQAEGIDFFLQCQASGSNGDNNNFIDGIVDRVCDPPTSLFLDGGDSSAAKATALSDPAAFICDVISNVTVTNDVISGVNSCVNSEVTGGELCAQVKGCEGSDNDELCACSVTQNGVPCETCEICSDGNGGQQGILLDCSNLEGGISMMDECQAVPSMESALTFVPAATARQVGEVVDDSGEQPNNENGETPLFTGSSSSGYWRSTMMGVASLLVGMILV